MHKISSFGCSLTFGTELADDGCHLEMPTASNLTWPALVAQRLGWHYKCYATGGIGNLCIMDRVLKHSYYNPKDVFVINWTFIDRFDYSDPAGVHFDRGLRDWSTARPSESDQVSEWYYRQVHSEYRDKLTALIYIKTTIDYLKARNISFVMTAIDDLLWCTKWHAPAHVTELQDHVRPHVKDFQGRNFLDWARLQGFEITAAGHPLEAAHAAAAELFLPKFLL